MKMARADGGHNVRGKWCSYKRTTVILCSVNVGVALYVLHSLYISLYMYSNRDSPTVVTYTPDQIRKIEESIQIRKASEPVELIKLVKKIEKDLYREERKVELPRSVKQEITHEIIGRLKALNASANMTLQRDAVQSWRKEKIKKVEKWRVGKSSNSTMLPEEAGMLARALESNWAELSEEIGLWIPPEIVNKEHDDKPEGEKDFENEMLAGKRLPPECHAELNTDYGGAAVRWGLTHHQDSAYECCQACLDQAKNAKPGEKKCNIWVYCPSETGCHSPDIYQHTLGECWLKYAEKPTLNFKNQYPESYRKSHQNAPLVVPWVSGVVST